MPFRYIAYIDYERFHAIATSTLPALPILLLRLPRVVIAEIWWLLPFHFADYAWWRATWYDTSYFALLHFAPLLSSLYITLFLHCRHTLPHIALHTRLAHRIYENVEIIRASYREYYATERRHNMIIGEFCRHDALLQKNANILYATGYAVVTRRRAQQQRHIQNTYAYIPSLNRDEWIYLHHRFTSYDHWR